MSDVKPHEAHRSSPAYLEGKKAYRAGLPSDANPYPSRGPDDARRLFWFDGYYETLIGDRHGATLRQYGESWP